MSNMMRSVSVAPLCALLVGVAVGLVSCADREEAAEAVRPVRVVRVGDISAFQGREFPGRAEARQWAELSFRVPGSVRALPARLGQHVQEGEVLAQLDRRDFEVRVRGVEASLARARAELTRAETEFARASGAFERGGMSEIELIRIREGMEVAAAVTRAIEAELESAKDDLADTSLRAPFAGEISARHVENYEDVQARQRVLRIVDDSSVRFTVFVPEQMIALLPLVEEVRCEFDAFPGVRIAATVDEIGREADAITRTFPVTLVMEQPEGVRILAGMSGRARVERIRPPDEVEADFFDLPPSALGEGADGVRFVWVLDEARGVVNRRSVTVGRISPTGIRVGNIERGELIVTAGAAFLREGQRVRKLDAPPAEVAAAASAGAER